MLASYPPAMYAVPYARPAVPYAPSLLRMGVVGAVIGSTGATAANLKRVQRNQISTEEAIRKTLKTGVSSAVATAAATAVAGMLGPERSLLTLVAMVATGAAVMYILEE